MHFKKEKIRNRLTQDAFIVIGSILIAVLIVRTNIVHEISGALQGWGALASFIGGLFFTTVFTTAPSIAILGELAQEYSLATVVFFGGLGAMCGDYILFRFMRDRVSEDLKYLFQHPKKGRKSALFRTKLPRFLWPLLGALIIASPLPDELGIAMIGLSRMTDKTFLPISFVMNCLGILLIGLAARAVS